jgi:hypothetical protein
MGTSLPGVNREIPEDQTHERDIDEEGHERELAE